MFRKILRSKDFSALLEFVQILREHKKDLVRSEVLPAFFMVITILLASCAYRKEMPSSSAATTATNEEQLTKRSLSVFEKTTSPPMAMDEEKEVYETVIISLYPEEELFVFRDCTTIEQGSGETLESKLEYVQRQLGSAVDPETLSDFKTKNRQSHKLIGYLSLDIPYVLLTDARFDEIFESDTGWNQFYNEYPNSAGVITLSSIGLNEQMDQALVYVGNQVDYLAGRGYYILLDKKGENWQVQNMVIAWIS